MCTYTSVSYVPVCVATCSDNIEDIISSKELSCNTLCSQLHATLLLTPGSHRSSFYPYMESYSMWSWISTYCTWHSSLDIYPPTACTSSSSCWLLSGAQESLPRAVIQRYFLPATMHDRVTKQRCSPELHHPGFLLGVRSKGIWHLPSGWEGKLRKCVTIQNASVLVHV